MDHFKEGARQRVRFSTTKGTLSVESLWDLPIPDLDALAVNLNEQYESSGKKSFIAKRSVKDRGIKLQLDIVLDVLETKVEEANISAQKKEDKEHNDRVIDAIKKKEDRDLGKKSVAELKAMLR